MLNIFINKLIRILQCDGVYESLMEIRSFKPQWLIAILFFYWHASKIVYRLQNTETDFEHII